MVLGKYLETYKNALMKAKKDDKENKKAKN
jgi:hypothetical protein